MDLELHHNSLTIYKLINIVARGWVYIIDTIYANKNMLYVTNLTYMRLFSINERKTKIYLF